MVCMYRGNKNVSMNLLPRAVTTIQTFFDSTNTMCIVGHSYGTIMSIALMKMKLETNITLIKEEGMNNNNRPTSGKTS